MKKYIAMLAVAAFAVTSYAGDTKACADKNKAACAGKEQAACCAGKDAVAKGASCTKGTSCAKGEVAKRVLQSPKAGSPS